MYWNNPLEHVTYPSNSDIIFKATHHGQHCLFWNPTARYNNITTNQTLTDLCDWANNHIQQQGIANFLKDPKCFYDLANLVKLNMWIRDIRQQGIVKPWLIQDSNNGQLTLGTGESRLRCLERIPEIQTVPAFISTHVSRSEYYHGLERVETFERFAELCAAEPGQQFLFRLTGADAPYGIDWYEYNSQRTHSVTPGESDALAMIAGYFNENPDIVISPEWFDQPIDWSKYYPNL